MRHTPRVLVVAMLMTFALGAASARPAPSSGYRFVGGAPITYTSDGQVVVIWRFNKAAPRGSNGSLKTGVNVSGVGYTGTPSNDPNIGFGATTLNKSHDCYQQVVSAASFKVGAQHTVTAYVWSNTVTAKSTLKKGTTTNASTAQSMAKQLGC